MTILREVVHIYADTLTVAAVAVAAAAVTYLAVTE